MVTTAMAVLLFSVVSGQPDGGRTWCPACARLLIREDSEGLMGRSGLVVQKHWRAITQGTRSHRFVNRCWDR